MNESAVIPTMLESAPSMPLASSAAALPESPSAGNAVALLNTNMPTERGSVAALLKRHAEKQAQGLAPNDKPFKPGKDAQDTPICLLAVAMREVPPDKLLQQAQENGDFPAACRRLRQCASRWAKDIQEEAQEEGRNLTKAERQGMGFWQCEAKQAETALRIFEAVGSDKRAAVEALDNADLERFAATLRSGCYVSLGL